MQAVESHCCPLQAATKIMAGMAEQQTEWMADGMVEWQTEMATYVLFIIHTDTDDTNNDDDTF